MCDLKDSFKYWECPRGHDRDRPSGLRDESCELCGGRNASHSCSPDETHEIPSYLKGGRDPILNRPDGIRATAKWANRRPQ